eukprot:12014270-Alexandrium_andersonii.AAC.1
MARLRPVIQRFGWCPLRPIRTCPSCNDLRYVASGHELRQTRPASAHFTESSGLLLPIPRSCPASAGPPVRLSLIHISEPTRLALI